MGDVITLNVLVDNGGTSAASQTWASTDTVSADLTVGGYHAYYDSDFFGSAGFTTDAAGNLLTADWFGTSDAVSGTNYDNFGVGTDVRLFNGAIQEHGSDLSFFQPSFGDINDWTAPTGYVPEPGTIAIWTVLGVVGLGVRRRRNA